MSKDWENYDFLSKTDAEIAIWLRNTSHALEDANKSRVVAAQSLLPFLIAETERRTQHEHPIPTLRSTTPAETSSLKNEMGMSFSDFDEAAELYKTIIQKIAPSRSLLA